MPILEEDFFVDADGGKPFIFKTFIENFIIANLPYKIKVITEEKYEKFNLNVLFVYPESQEKSNIAKFAFGLSHPK